MGNSDLVAQALSIMLRPSPNLSGQVILTASERTTILDALQSEARRADYFERQAEDARRDLLFYEGMERP